MPLRIVLVRHGLSSFNLEHRIQGRDDLSQLSELGVIQAKAAGTALKDLPLTAVYASPLSRAADTARHLLAARGSAQAIVFDDDLLEVDLSPWSGLRSSEVRERFPEKARQWLHAPAELELEGADGRLYRPIPELLEQAQRFIDRLLERHGADSSTMGTVLLVAHNAILRCLILQLLGRSANDLRRLRIDNGSISVLNLERGSEGTLQVQIESLNGIAHLGAGLPAKGAGQRLLLVRHGETDWNRQGRFQGQIDIPLNANGRAQAQAAAAFLEVVTFQRAYTSSMARPRQTAEMILAAHPGVPLTSVPALVEIGHGLWEGCLEEEIAEGWPQLLADWKRAPHTVQMPEGENLQDVWDRSLEGWNRIVAALDPSETALVVAHDAVNKTILCALLGLTPADIWTVKQGNGGVTVIDYPHGPEGMPLVAALNLTTHLGGVIDRTAAGAL
ncbi:histidine phosphatase family protein [Cyanobium sp. Morenito 9A2]|uniref:histidine phosphatase family protein n=1 Tax=Cyanobium sp. Morenito 9A2 TaxID=2823718 RepID=UPI0020CE34AC|nr:histidine phosphatase family protein [Cyanobium sp. Morenito 9A2]MCP9849328.1 histidine phosphatase family protein [Cyanobium sp. Morenito 9A2]